MTLTAESGFDIIHTNRNRGYDNRDFYLGGSV